MINPFWVLKREGKITDTVRAAFIETYGKRGKTALDAVENGQVKKYLDFFVVVGKNDEYCIDGEFCSCTASKYGNKCWHTLAVQIAQEIHSYEEYNLWYYKNGMDDDLDEKKD